MEKKLERRLNFLTAYAVLSTVAFGAILLTSFRGQDRTEAVDELTVKRINVVAEDGKLRMVISNDYRQHSGRMNGKDMPKRERPAGIIFFNTEGDECGGLVYRGEKVNGVVQSGMSFTMDQYGYDQVIQILNTEMMKDSTLMASRGFKINDLPLVTMEEVDNQFEAAKKITDATARAGKLKELRNKYGGTSRLFLGKAMDSNTGLFISDASGKPKIKIYVDKDGTPKLEVLASDGSFKNMLGQ